MFKILLLGYVQLLKNISSLGDQGYQLKPWIMTRLTNPRTLQEQAYNHAHVRTRSTVELKGALTLGHLAVAVFTPDHLRPEP